MIDWNNKKYSLPLGHPSSDTAFAKNSCREEQMFRVAKNFSSEEREATLHISNAKPSKVNYSIVPFAINHQVTKPMEVVTPTSRLRRSWIQRL